MESIELPEYYTTTELENMTMEQLAAAKASGFRKQGPMPLPSIAVPTPAPAPVQERPAAEVWGSTEYDFVCPSGAKCRMRKLMPEKLLEFGILDRISTLPGVAAGVVDKAEGAPPKPGDMPDAQDIKDVVGILEVLLPAVVVSPVVYAVPVVGDDGEVPERVVGRIYTDSIELTDRIAIMERAVQGVQKLVPFRS